MERGVSAMAGGAPYTGLADRNDVVQVSLATGELVGFTRAAGSQTEFEPPPGLPNLRLSYRKNDDQYTLRDNGVEVTFHRPTKEQAGRYPPMAPHLCRHGKRVRRAGTAEQPHPHGAHPRR